MNKQANKIPAKCPECQWEGKLLECFMGIPICFKLSGGWTGEYVPQCPKCDEMVDW